METRSNFSPLKSTVSCRRGSSLCSKPISEAMEIFLQKLRELHLRISENFNIFAGGPQEDCASLIEVTELLGFFLNFPNAEFTFLKEIFNIWSNLFILIPNQMITNIAAEISAEFIVQIFIVISEIGHYNTQRNGLYVLMKLLKFSREKKETVLERIPFEYIHHVGHLLAHFDFNNAEVEFRHILNAINKQNGSSKTVASVKVLSLYINGLMIKKPEQQKFEDFWVDFNRLPETISFYCRSLVFGECDNDFPVFIEARISDKRLMQNTLEVMICDLKTDPPLANNDIFWTGQTSYPTEMKTVTKNKNDAGNIESINRKDENNSSCCEKKLPLRLVLTVDDPNAFKILFSDSENCNLKSKKLPFSRSDSQNILLNEEISLTHNANESIETNVESDHYSREKQWILIQENLKAINNRLKPFNDLESQAISPNSTKRKLYNIESSAARTEEILKIRATPARRSLPNSRSANHNSSFCKAEKSCQLKRVALSMTGLDKQTFSNSGRPEVPKTNLSQTLFDLSSITTRRLSDANEYFKSHKRKLYSEGNIQASSTAQVANRRSLRLANTQYKRNLDTNPPNEQGLDISINLNQTVSSEENLLELVVVTPNSLQEANKHRESSNGSFETEIEMFDSNVSNGRVEARVEGKIERSKGGRDEGLCETASPVATFEQDIPMLLNEQTFTMEHCQNKFLSITK